MQELTRSLIRFSWAMPLLGLSQMTGLFAPGSRRPVVETAETLEALSRTAYSQMEPGLQDLYNRGDRLQRRVTDAVFRSRTGTTDTCCGDGR